MAYTGITVEDVKRIREDLNKNLPKTEQIPIIEDGTGTHYFFNGPSFYGYVSKMAFNNLMKEEIQKMFASK